MILTTLFSAALTITPLATAMQRAPDQAGGVVAQPTPQSSRTGQVPREIWAACWRAVPSDCAMLTEMIRLEGHFHQGFPTASRSTRPSPAAIAARTRTIPPGRAAIQWWRYANSLFSPDPIIETPIRTDLSTAVPWDPVAVAAVEAEWSKWLSEFKAAGGKLDVLVGDSERWGIFTSWSLSATQIQRIASDPRARQPYYGAPPLTTMLEGTNVARVKSYLETTDYLRWDRAIGTLTAASMQKAVWEPARRVFPALKGSNYLGMIVSAQPSPDLNGHPSLWNNVVGTAASPVAYGEMEHISTAWFIDPADPTRMSKSGTRRLAQTPWNAFLLDLQRGRSCKRSAPQLPLQPWVALQIWRGGGNTVVPYADDLRYHDEMVRHYALLETEFFIYWNSESDGKPGTTWSEADRVRCARRLNSVLLDINAQTKGVVASAATVAPVAFDAKVVTSGARRIDGKWVWRTTAAPGVQALRDTRTRQLVPLDSSGVGRWDITDTATAPQLENAALQAIAAPTSLPELAEPGRR